MSTTTYEVGQTVDVVTTLAPRRTARATLTKVEQVANGDVAFEAVSVDGQTAYRGWISTFHYLGKVTGVGDLCGADKAGSSETIAHVMRHRVLFCRAPREAQPDPVAHAALYAAVHWND